MGARPDGDRPRGGRPRASEEARDHVDGPPDRQLARDGERLGATGEHGADPARPDARCGDEYVRLGERLVLELDRARLVGVVGDLRRRSVSVSIAESAASAISARARRARAMCRTGMGMGSPDVGARRSGRIVGYGRESRHDGDAASAIPIPSVMPEIGVTCARDAAPGRAHGVRHPSRSAPCMHGPRDHRASLISLPGDSSMIRRRCDRLARRGDGRRSSFARARPRRGAGPTPRRARRRQAGGRAAAVAERRVRDRRRAREAERRLHHRAAVAHRRAAQPAQRARPCPGLPPELRRFFEMPGAPDGRRAAAQRARRGLRASSCRPTATC